jgi:hypothetical protein
VSDDEMDELLEYVADAAADGVRDQLVGRDVHVVVVLVSPDDDGVLVGSRGRVVTTRGTAPIKGLLPAIQRSAELVVEHDHG